MLWWDVVVVTYFRLALWLRWFSVVFMSSYVADSSLSLFEEGPACCTGSLSERELLRSGRYVTPFCFASLRCSH